MSIKDTNIGVVGYPSAPSSPGCRLFCRIPLISHQSMPPLHKSAVVLYICLYHLDTIYKEQTLIPDQIRTKKVLSIHEFLPTRCNSYRREMVPGNSRNVELLRTNSTRRARAYLVRVMGQERDGVEGIWHISRLRRVLRCHRSYATRKTLWL